MRVPGLPGCLTEGDTLAEAKKMTREAIAVWLSVNRLREADPQDRVREDD